MSFSFCKMLESVQDTLDTRKVSESTTHSRLSEPDTVSNLYRIDYIRASYKLVIIVGILNCKEKDADYDWSYLTAYL